MNYVTHLLVAAAFALAVWIVGEELLGEDPDRDPDRSEW